MLTSGAMAMAMAPLAGAFTPAMSLRGTAPALHGWQRAKSHATPRAAARHGSHAATIRMAGAGGKAVALDSDGFDSGDADPIGSIDALNKVGARSPRACYAVSTRSRDRIERKGHKMSAASWRPLTHRATFYLDGVRAPYPRW